MEVSKSWGPASTPPQLVSLSKSTPLLSYLNIFSRRAPQMKQPFSPQKKENTKTLACKASAFDASKSFTCKIGRCHSLLKKGKGPFLFEICQLRFAGGVFDFLWNTNMLTYPNLGLMVDSKDLPCLGKACSPIGIGNCLPEIKSFKMSQGIKRSSVQSKRVSWRRFSNKANSENQNVIL